MDKELKAPVIREGHDPFNGFVLLCKDDEGYWVEHQRNDEVLEITDYLQEDEAEAKYNECINNTQFA